MKKPAAKPRDCQRCHNEDALPGLPLGKRCVAVDERAKIKKARKELKEVKSVASVARFVKLPPAMRDQILNTAAQPLTSPPPVDGAVAALRRWRNQPWTYVREVFKATPDLWQDIILHAAVGQNVDGTPLTGHDRNNLKIALKACKGPGKTCVMAWIAWWFLTCFEHPNILATSITGDNLRDNLWKEMAVWQKKSPLLEQMFEWQTERIFLKAHPETWWMSARTWPKEADRNRQATTLAGLHGKHTLLLLDESGGIPEAVLVAGLAHHSTVTVGAGADEIHITLQCGNPDTLDGALGVACTRDRERWFVYEITGDPDDPARAPRMDIEWCREQIEVFGREHPWVLVNVFGKFPPQQDNKLIGPEAVRAAQSLVIPEDVWRRAQRVAALDVARSLNRDRSSLARRQGPIVYPFRVWRLDDTSVLTSQVAYELSVFKPAAIFVDATGIGGPVGDNLRSLGFNVIMVYFGNPARDRRFADKRTEIWWTMAQEIKGGGGVPGVCLPQSGELLTDLTGPLIMFDLKGRIRMESKEQMQKRGLKSPDLGDSLAMTYAETVMAEVELPGFVAQSLRHNRVQTEYDPYSDPEVNA